MPRDLPPQTLETLQFEGAVKTALLGRQIAEEALDAAVQSIANRYGCTIEAITCTTWFNITWWVCPHKATGHTPAHQAVNLPVVRELHRVEQIGTELDLEPPSGRTWTPEHIAEPVHA